MPAFAAAADGLFADRGLQVSFVEQGGRPARVAAGDADFGLTAVVYLLQAQAEAEGQLPVRFVGVLHQRNPISGMVAEQSGLREPHDLAGRRTAEWALRWMRDEYTAALARLDLRAGPFVEVADGHDPSALLARGDIDVIPTWADTVPVRSKAGVRVLPVSLDLPVYASGVVAADHVTDEVAARMRDALGAGLELQRRHPELGIAEFSRRYPSIPRTDVEVNWSLFDRFGLRTRQRQVP